MFRTLAAAVVTLVLTAASADAQTPYKLGMQITSYGNRSVIIDEVFAGSLAEQMGLQSGDVIYGINGGSTNDVLAFRDAVFASDRVTLNVKRGGRYYTNWVQFNAVRRQNTTTVMATVKTTEVAK